MTSFNFIYILKKIFLLCIGLFGYISLYSQITFGSLNTPESFSVLQLEEMTEVKGLRLSQINNKAPLNTKVNLTPQKAKGLFIYNTITKNTEYWNGTKWLQNSLTINNASNGLSLNNATLDVKLGGTLTENTNITLGTYKLDFLTGHLGIFNVNDQFKIENSSITAISDTVILGSQSEVIITGTPSQNGVSIERNLHIVAGSSTLHVKPDSLALTGDFILHDSSSEGITTTSVTSTNLEDKNFVFSNDIGGRAFWALLRPEFQRKDTTFLSIGESASGVPVPSSASEISNSMQLSTGKWLIYARLPLQSKQMSASIRMHFWFLLRLNVNGTITYPAGIGASVDYSGLCIPELIYLLDVKEDLVTITMTGSNSDSAPAGNRWNWNWGTEDLNNTYGAPEFFALLLDKPVNL